MKLFQFSKTARENGDAGREGGPADVDILEIGGGSLWHHKRNILTCSCVCLCTFQYGVYAWSLNESKPDVVGNRIRLRPHQRPAGYAGISRSIRLQRPDLAWGIRHRQHRAAANQLTDDSWGILGEPRCWPAGKIRRTTVGPLGRLHPKPCKQLSSAFILAASNKCPKPRNERSVSAADQSPAATLFSLPLRKQVLTLSRGRSAPYS